MTSDDVPYHPPCHQDTYCPKCGAGFPTLQNLDVYNNGEYLGEYYRFYCNVCEYATLIHYDPEQLREEWEREHEKNLPNHLYNKYVNYIINVLENQKGYYYTNALLELGAQVAEGESLDYEYYVTTIEDIARKFVEPLPYITQKMLFDKIVFPVFIDVDEDEPISDYIVKEIFDRVCRIAESVFDDYQSKEE